MTETEIKEMDLVRMTLRVVPDEEWPAPLRHCRPGLIMFRDSLLLLKTADGKYYACINGDEWIVDQDEKNDKNTEEIMEFRVQPAKEAWEME